VRPWFRALQCLGERAVATGEFRVERGKSIASDLTEFKNCWVAH